MGEDKEPDLGSLNKTENGKKNQRKNYHDDRMGNNTVKLYCFIDFNIHLSRD